jgi:hypothetical protein
MREVLVRDLIPAREAVCGGTKRLSKDDMLSILRGAELDRVPEQHKLEGFFRLFYHCRRDPRLCAYSGCYFAVENLCRCQV